MNTKQLKQLRAVEKQLDIVIENINQVHAEVRGQDNDTELATIEMLQSLEFVQGDLKKLVSKAWRKVSNRSQS